MSVCLTDLQLSSGKAVLLFELILMHNFCNPFPATPVPVNMDLEDDTTVLTTLKSFNSFISQTEPPQRLSEHSVGSGNLQSQYKRSMEVRMN